MAYYLRREKKKNGVYLQMYESYWDREKKQPRSRNIESFGYVEKLASEDMPDPVAFYTDYVNSKNEERAKALNDETRPRSFSSAIEMNIGLSLIHI